MSPLRPLAVVLALTGAMALPSAAAAKGDEPMGIRLDSSASGLRAGQPWDLTFTVLAAPAAQRLREPAVWIEDRALTPATFFDARPTGRPGQYRARVTFPAPGNWTFTIGERHGRFFDQGPVRVAAAARKSSATLGAAPVAAFASLVLVLAGGALVRRRRRDP